MTDFKFQHIFDKDPECGFELRGDIYLWNMFRAATRNHLISGEYDIDGLQSDLEKMVRSLYQLATGKKLSGKGQDKIPFFFKVGYGMSKGLCCREWWIDKALPILNERLDNIVGDCTKGKRNILILQTDILKRSCDAIVSPSNTTLLPTGGLGGAIRKAAGDNLNVEIKRLPKNSNGERCAEGDVRVTGAGSLKCKHIFHAVGPNCQRGVTQEAKDNLKNCYRKVALAAQQNDCATIAIPSIATGKYAFPIADAATIAAEVFVRESMVHPQRKFVFCIPDEKTAVEFRNAIGKVSDKMCVKD